MRTLLVSLWLSLLGCGQPSAQTDSLSIAPPDYLVLAQKALTYQADFDTTALADMLAESVQYQLVEPSYRWQGKRAVLAGWQHWQEKAGIERIRLSGLTHLPVQSEQPLALLGKAGVYVVSYCTAHVCYRNGSTAEQPLHVCYHFDADKRIDWGWLTMPDSALCLLTRYALDNSPPPDQPPWLACHSLLMPDDWRREA